MYSREQAKKIKEAFWTAYGQYMRVIPSADGERVNWVNYKTGIKHVYFRMNTTNKSATIGIQIDHPDEGIRSLMFEQFEQFKTLLSNETGEEWIWEDCYNDLEGKQVSFIYTELSGTSIFNQDDWAALISFFKPRIIALDSFWSTAKYSFEIFK